jgi:deoxyadenosine/deoxycytidine kinase
MIIAFEGLPGAGKTTTAQLIAADLHASSVVESTQEHPFLESVYSDDARHDLEIELAFLLLHANAWRAINPAVSTVTDFTPVKDLVFARDTLTAEEDLNLFELVYGRLHEGSAMADVVVYLRATPELALQRVRRRFERDEHRSFEQTLELDRLRRIEHQYDAHRALLGANVLVLDLIDVLRPDEQDEQSKRRVARAALDLIEQHRRRGPH